MIKLTCGEYQFPDNEDIVMRNLSSTLSMVNFLRFPLAVEVEDVAELTNHTSVSLIPNMLVTSLSLLQSVPQIVSVLESMVIVFALQLS